MRVCSNMPPVNIRFDKSAKWTPVALPGSKSIAARALICRYVYGVATPLINLPSCDDTRELKRALDKLEAALPDPLPRIREFGELPPVQLDFNLGNGGTSLRFFLALAASLPGLEAEIDCAEGLRKRPLAPLVNALRDQGADITYLRQEGYPPLLVRGRRLKGGRLTLDGSKSSQFFSAMLMVEPLWLNPIDRDPEREAHQISAPYVEMTRRVIEQFRNKPERYVIESDWSAASYFYELALAMPGRRLEIERLTDSAHSIQGDRMCQQLFEYVGVRTERLDGDPHGAVALCCDAEVVEKQRRTGMPVLFKLRDTPDLTPALAAGLCMAGLPFDFPELEHLRVKESDRLLSISTELGKAGYAVNGDGDGLKWDGRRYPVAEDETFCGWGDHRIAMSIAMLATRLNYVAIDGGMVVTKSFPDFYDQIRNLGFKVKLPANS